MISYLDRRDHRARLVRDAMRAKLLLGEWIGTLPSEHELGREFDTGRNVIRCALALLVEENFLRRVHGHGTEPTTYRLLHELNTLRSIAEDGETSPHRVQVRYRLLDWTILDPPPVIRSQLQLPDGVPAIRWERITLAPEPLTLWSSYLRGDLDLHLPAVDTTVAQAGTFACIESAGHVVAGASHVTGAASADPGVAELLRIRPGDPTMVQHRKTYLCDGMLAEIGTGYYRADQIFLVNSFSRREHEAS